MNAKTIRLIVIALLLLLLPLLLSSPALAEEAKTLDLDHLTPGSVPLEEGFLSANEYKDDTIHVTWEEQTYNKQLCHIIRIKIE
ncbi:MAG: hypothetical protein IJD94_02200, partial [Clostridia bacterium]|nr:hypothetical protein [Clostridia bacterium]